MLRICEGSESAVWQLIEKYSSNIVRAVRRRMPDDLRRKVDSTDIAQSVWKSLLRKDHGLDAIATSEQFVALISEMARRKTVENERFHKRTQARDMNREVQLHSKSSDDVAVGGRAASCGLPDRSIPTPSSMAELQESWERCLDASGERARAIVQLRLQQVPDEQIAARLQISVSTVRRIVHNMVESLAS
jgi:RNA polymerase sigma factor (sigma-70 family)